MDSRSVHLPPAHGANVRDDGVDFGVWAPNATTVDVILFEAEDTRTHRLQADSDGVHSGFVQGLEAGVRYKYSLDNGPGYPDPRSRYQPEGVHGPSEIIDLSRFEWTDHSWPGIRNQNLSIYEVHIGTYTPEGTLHALAQQLPAIRELGVRVIELMPVADFPGRWNWGYDVVAMYATSRNYGRPENLQQFVDKAHQLGLAVILDVVYNHLGPDGNYLRIFSDAYFTDRHTTPWGEAVNYDGPDCRFVRDFAIDNAVQWTRDYHLDGLRLDATDTIRDDSEIHLLAELQSAVRDATERNVVIIAEEARNQVRTVQPMADGGYGIDAVWADDFHHEMRVFLSNAWENYYSDYAGTPWNVATALNEGFIFQGEYSDYWQRPRGTKVTHEPAGAFVIALQNHDQVGNRPFGERLHHQVNADLYAVASTLLLLAPETPLVFMGQEFAASTPFLYFTDHNEKLGRLVTDGRRREFGGFRAFEDPESQNLIPDPQAEATYLSSRLDLSERDRHSGMYSLYRRLLEIRHDDPAFAEPARSSSRATPVGANAIALHRWHGEDHGLVLANFGSELIVDFGSLDDRELRNLRNWTEILSTQTPEFGGQDIPSTFNSDGAGLSIHIPARTAVVLSSD